MCRLRRLAVMITIHLDGEVIRQASEIQNEASDRSLIAKMIPMGSQSP